MNTLEAIFKRRSIRRYTPDLVKEEDIETIIKAAMAAPSAHNSHPCYYIILRDRALMDRIGNQYIYHKMLQRSNAAIVLCADAALMHEDMDIFMVDDCAAAMENMLLAASDLGLGAVWLGIHSRKEFTDNLHEWLKIPQEIFVHSIICLGYPQGEQKEVDRLQPQRVYRDVWGFMENE
ncbi:MAG: nitroreductase family protein [Christensenellales bacterium]